MFPFYTLEKHKKKIEIHSRVKWESCVLVFFGLPFAARVHEKLSRVISKNTDWISVGIWFCNVPSPLGIAAVWRQRPLLILILKISCRQSCFFAWKLKLLHNNPLVMFCSNCFGYTSSRDFFTTVNIVRLKNNTRIYLCLHHLKNVLIKLNANRQTGKTSNKFLQISNNLEKSKLQQEENCTTFWHLPFQSSKHLPFPWHLPFQSSKQHALHAVFN